MDAVADNQMMRARATARRVQAASRKGYIGVLCAYLILGNLPRMISLSDFADKINASETVLFLAAMLVAALHPAMTRSFIVRWFPVNWIIIYSFLYGTLINGFMVTPALYAVRLLLLLFAGDIAGNALYRRYGADLPAAIRTLGWVFAVQMAIGFVLFVVFPDLAVLWQLLYENGLDVGGDPHHRRFVASVFDPNYYAAIAAFYLLVYFYDWRYRARPLSGILLATCLVSILLTGSRSGIPAGLAMLLIIGWQLRRPIVAALTTLRLGYSTARIIGVLIALLIALWPVYWPSVEFTLHKFQIMDSDLSAKSRYDTFYFGNEVISERPLWGLGYNYLVPLARAFNGHPGLNSSVQTLVATFGMVLSLALLALLVLWAARVHRRLATRMNEDPNLREFFAGYLGYLAVTIIFTCQFNNVLFLTFWLVPTVAVGSYFTFISQGTACQGSPAASDGGHHLPDREGRSAHAR